MRRLRALTIAFTAIGLALLAGASTLALRTRAFVARAVSSDGVVVDLVESRSKDGSTWRPVVAFAGPEGRKLQFTTSSSSSPPAYQRGEHVEVLTDPADPTDHRIRGFLDLWFAPVLLGGLGTVFSTIGLGLFGADRFRRRRGEWLKHHGTRIETSFQRVELDKAFTFNGRSPYRVVTQWLDPATNEVHLFESERLWFDPSPYLTGPTVPVLIERGNPKRYWVDLSFLPKLAA